VTPVIAEADKNLNGYLKTGNVEVEMDVLGNAAVLDVYKFLTLKMEDAKTLIDHIKEDSALALKLLSIPTESYQTLKDCFLEIAKSADDSDVITSSKIKQFFFPVEENYHQFSIVSNSGVIYELKKRIDTIRFSNDGKEAREQKYSNSFSEQGFIEIYNLTTISFGGTKPQNISVLNNQNGGRAYLLLSAPPKLKKRDIRFPKENFFSDSFRDFEYRDIFEALHRLFKTDYNNARIREGRDYRLQELMDHIIHKMWAVRAVAKDQYRPKRSRLKEHQKIWLCEEFFELREAEDEWLDKLCKEIAAWTIRTYERLLGKRAYKLGDAYFSHVQKVVIQNREALR
jgi:CRISPR-associated protein Csy1